MRGLVGAVAVLSAIAYSSAFVPSKELAFVRNNAGFQLTCDGSKVRELMLELKCHSKGKYEEYFRACDLFS